MKQKQKIELSFKNQVYIGRKEKSTKTIFTHIFICILRKYYYQILPKYA
jgi:hypothetical protein